MRHRPNVRGECGGIGANDQLEKIDTGVLVSGGHGDMGDDDQLEKGDKGVAIWIGRRRMRLGTHRCRQWWWTDIDERHPEMTARGGPAGKQVLGMTKIVLDARGMIESTKGNEMEGSDEHGVLDKINEDEGHNNQGE